MTATFRDDLANRTDRILTQYGVDVDNPGEVASGVLFLLADLLHYCRSRGYDFDTLLHAARIQFGTEIDGGDR